MGLQFGFYGKLPSQGDFVSRRLPWEFTEAWDAWLQAGLAQARADAGAQWLQHYLTAPVWRFALAAGLAGPGAWLGLWFPSVDRVGRHFPMTVAAAWPANQPLPALVAADDSAWQALEDQALVALDPGTTLDRYDAALQAPGQALGGLAPPAASASSPWQVRPLAGDTDAAGAAAGTASAPVAFFTWGGEQVQPTHLQAAQLPDAARFAGFLHGGWPAA